MKTKGQLLYEKENPKYIMVTDDKGNRFMTENPTFHPVWECITKECKARWEVRAGGTV